MLVLRENRYRVVEAPRSNFDIYTVSKEPKIEHEHISHVNWSYNTEEDILCVLPVWFVLEFGFNGLRGIDEVVVPGV